MENKSKSSQATVKRMVGNYQIGQFLGQGAFSEVFKAKSRDTSSQFAIKIISNKILQQNEKVKQCIHNQINIHQSLQSSPHIIRFYQLLQTKNNCYFVYQYCEGGNLYQYLQKHGKLEIKKALSIFKQIVQALKVLRKQKIMHRDLKPQNVLIKNGIFKLADFGFGKTLQQSSMTSTMLGSPLYMAPQVLKGESYTISADIWSIGVILYEMIQGRCPFESRSISSLISTIEEVPLGFSMQIPIELQQFIKKCLQKDMNKRISWSQLFSQAQILTNNWMHRRKQKMKSQQIDNNNEFSKTLKTKFELYKQSYNKNSQITIKNNSGLKTISLDIKKQIKNKQKLSYKQIVNRHGICLTVLQLSLKQLQEKGESIVLQVKQTINVIKKVMQRIYYQTDIDDPKTISMLSHIKIQINQLQKMQNQLIVQNLQETSDILNEYQAKLSSYV